MKKYLLISFSFYSVTFFSQDFKYQYYNPDPYGEDYKTRIINLADNADWKVYEKGKRDSISAYGSGDIYTLLFSSGKIPDPYTGSNEEKLQWLSEKSWVYETSFYPEIYLSAEKKNKTVSSIFHFEGLNTYASVFINDSLILTSENAFRIYEVDMTKKLMQGKENFLRIEFEPAQKKGKELAAAYPVKLPGGERVFTRKPQYQYGWDWGPKFVTCGTGKILFIQRTSKSIKTEKPKITTENISGTNARLKISSAISCFEPQTVFVNCVITNPNKIYARTDTSFFLSKKISLKKGDNAVSFDALIKNVSLWYPRFYGEQNFYRVTFSITSEHPKKKVKGFIYETLIPYAICKTELVREKDFAGETFYFRVNGKRIYARGFNYIPGDFFFPNAAGQLSKGNTSTETADLINAYEMNCNMIRVWGGGVYAHESFYTFCLLNGMMVWQDFMYACAMYPYDEKFLENAKIEAEQQTKRLQNFSNIVLWCGNNENDEGWNNWGWQKEFNYSKKDSAEIYSGNKKLFEDVLPSALKKNISSADYIPSSPQFGWGREKSMLYGDSHYWGVWWGLEPIENFNKKVPRFMSEFGMQALPDLDCFKRFIPDSLMNFKSKEFLNHQKHPTGFKTLNHYLKNYFYETENLTDYSYLTQCLQAYTLSTAIEAQRRNFPYCNGSLVWQLNDCWPSVSWSVTDYNGRKKIAAHEIEKAFDTLLISMKEERGRYDFYLINDSDFSLEDSLEFYIADFSGKHLSAKKIQVKCGARSSTVIFQLNEKELDSIQKNKVFAIASLKKNIYRKNFHFVKPNELLLEPPKIKMYGVEDSPNGHNRISAVLQSATYCPFVKIYSQEYPSETYHYIPFILPGEKTTLPKKLFQSVSFPQDVLLRLGKEIRCLNEFAIKK